MDLDFFLRLDSFTLAKKSSKKFDLEEKFGSGSLANKVLKKSDSKKIFISKNRIRLINFLTFSEVYFYIKTLVRKYLKKTGIQNDWMKPSAKFKITYIKLKKISWNSEFITADIAKPYLVFFALPTRLFFATINHTKLPLHS